MPKLSLKTKDMQLVYSVGCFSLTYMTISAISEVSIIKTLLDKGNMQVFSVVTWTFKKNHDTVGHCGMKSSHYKCEIIRLRHLSKCIHTIQCIFQIC